MRKKSDEEYEDTNNIYSPQNFPTQNRNDSEKTNKDLQASENISLTYSVDVSGIMCSS
jgi:hypothetical protein